MSVSLNFLMLIIFGNSFYTQTNKIMDANQGLAKTISIVSIFPVHKLSSSHHWYFNADSNNSSKRHLYQWGLKINRGNDGACAILSIYAVIKRSGDYRQTYRRIKYAFRFLYENSSFNFVDVNRIFYDRLFLNYHKIEESKHTVYADTVGKNKEIENIRSEFLRKIRDNQIRILKEEKIFREAELGKDRLGKFVGMSFTIVLILLSVLLFRSNKKEKNLNLLLSKQIRESIEQNRQLLELNETKNKLFSIIGHDLRAPLASLSNIIGLMQDKTLLADEQEFFLNKISEAMVATDYLLNNLLYWAKSQMNGFVLNKTSFDLCAIIRQNFSLFQHRKNEKSITLQLNSTCNSVLVYADEAMIDIIIRNLLDNALKYTSAGDSIAVELTLSIDFVKLAVKDSGRGITIADQARLFNKLNSITTFGTNNEKGSGLGLLLCKDLIEINGGEIGYKSEFGHGSIFYITIPVNSKIHSEQ